MGIGAHLLTNGRYVLAHGPDDPRNWVISPEYREYVGRGDDVVAVGGGVVVVDDGAVAGGGGGGVEGGGGVAGGGQAEQPYLYRCGKGTCVASFWEQMRLDTHRDNCVEAQNVITASNAAFTGVVVGDGAVAGGGVAVAGDGGGVEGGGEAGPHCPYPCGMVNCNSRFMDQKTLNTHWGSCVEAQKVLTKHFANRIYTCPGQVCRGKLFKNKVAFLKHYCQCVHGAAKPVKASQPIKALKEKGAVREVPEKWVKMSVTERKSQKISAHAYQADSQAAKTEKIRLKREINVMRASQKKKQKRKD